MFKKKKSIKHFSILEHDKILVHVNERINKNKMKRIKSISRIPFNERQIYMRDEKIIKSFKKQQKTWIKSIGESCEKIKRPVMKSLSISDYRQK